VNAALAGHLRVFVSEDPMVSYYFSKADSWGEFRRAQKPLLATDLRVGVRKGDKELLALVEKGMARITDKDRARIQKKWTGDPLAPHIPWKWLLAAAAALLGLIGAVVLWNTQLRRQVSAATRTLRQSQERFLQVAQNAQEWIWEVDPEGLFTYCSPAAETIMGYTPAELVGRRHYFDLFHAADRDEILARSQELFKKTMPFHGFESRNTSKTGKDVWLSTTGVAILDGQGVVLGFRGVNVDITEKRKNEQELQAHRERLEELVAERTEALEETHAQLLQAQKMEAIGVLSGGIAHDFNNILAAISGTAELMQRNPSLDQGLRRQVQRIQNSSRRARDLTMKLLTFARKEKLDVQTVAPNEIVADVADMLQAMPPRIILETRLAPNPPRVIVDRNQIGQALLNICINACDAIDGQGAVIIETYEKHCSEKDGAPAPGAYSAMRVSDTGSGMDPDVQSKIFEPFFTTKERGKGTGLGLSVTLGIIQSHGGALNVTSAPGQGAVFEILLPVADGLETPAAASSDPGSEPQAAATLLVVDDDEDFLNTICECLELDGNKVLRAPGGVEALEIFAGRKGAIDLVILDMLMPGMDGSAVFHALHAEDPALKILICSGYSVEGRATDLLDAGACGFIQKPFDFNELSQTITDALNA
jgi:PAS domain S-box-containing protein